MIASEKREKESAKGNTFITRTRWPGRSGLGKTYRSVMSAVGSATARGPEKWSAMAKTSSEWEGRGHQAKLTRPRAPRSDIFDGEVNVLEGHYEVGSNEVRTASSGRRGSVTTQLSGNPVHDVVKARTSSTTVPGPTANLSGLARSSVTNRNSPVQALRRNSLMIATVKSSPAQRRYRSRMARSRRHSGAWSWWISPIQRPPKGVWC